MSKLIDWLLIAAVMILPGFVTLTFLWLTQDGDDDWNLF